MSDAPPSWVTDGPDPAAPPPQSRGNSRRAPRDEPDDDVSSSTTTGEFFEWLKRRQTKKQIEDFLQGMVPVNAFIETAITAVKQNPKLLADAYRESLFDGILKAAKMAIPPDGRLGVLIPRWNSNLRKTLIVFQVGYPGIVMAGRRTGAIKEIVTGIIYEGENHQIIAGDTPSIQHIVNPTIVDEAQRAMATEKVQNQGGKGYHIVADTDAWLERVVLAYCVITSQDGTKVRDWITRSRLKNIRLSVAEGGPWHGPFIDQMCRKSAIFLAAKLIDMDQGNPATRAFRSAVLDDLEIEHEPAPRPVQRALPSPGTKLQTMEEMLAPMAREKEPARRRRAEAAELAEREAAAPSGVTGGTGATGPTGATAAPPPPETRKPAAEAAQPPAEDDTKPPVEFSSVRQFADYVKGVMLATATIEEWEAFMAKPWFHDALVKARKIPRAATAVKEIDSMMAERKAYLEALRERRT